MKNIHALAQSLPYLHKAMKGEVSIVVVEKETEQVINYIPGTRLNVGFKIGDKIKRDDALLTNALRGQYVEAKIPKEIYGLEFDAYVIPVLDNSIVSGCIGLGIPMDNTLKLETYMETMNTIIQNLQQTIQTISIHSQELANSTLAINKQAEIAYEDAANSNKITELIKGISRHTNLLGINASIEAAHAGTFGAGFGIVAQEIRKLSLDTSTATANIETSLINVQNNLNGLKENIEKINFSSTEQSQLIINFSNKLNELHQLSFEMKEFMSNALNDQYFHILFQYGSSQQL